MTRRFLSLWFPRFPTDRWRRLRPESAGPLALIQSGQGGVRLTAVDAAATSVGLAQSMNLADARALVPNLVAEPAAPEADAAALAGLAQWCSRWSPWCAADGADGLALDITGCAHLFGGEEVLLADACARLARTGFAVQGAVADTPAAGWGWARWRPAGAQAILPPGETGPLLALPVAALRLEAETVETLVSLGLTTVGMVAALPRGPLALRLGEGLLERLDRMFGRLAEPISPAAPARVWRAHRLFAEPIGTRADIDAATADLVERLCRALATEGQGARRLELAFYRVDAHVQCLAIGTSRPSHVPVHLLRLFAERLEQVEPGFGIEAMVLEALVAEPLALSQAALDATAEIDPASLAALIDRLQSRLGAGRVMQLVPVESHVPERAECHAPAEPSPPHRFAAGPSLSRKRARGFKSLAHEVGEGGARRSVSGGGRVRGVWTPPAKSARPLRLLPIPEPIEAMAPIPDDPPLTFRWRKIVHRVAAADGPERIGPEWWRAEGGRCPRDYYRVEDSEGRRFWLYREGLFGGKEPPRWFLHGFFA
jgi:protein ImuB